MRPFLLNNIHLVLSFVTIKIQIIVFPCVIIYCPKIKYYFKSAAKVLFFFESHKKNDEKM